jgi:amino acid adenylation domain-containing protein
VNLSVAVFLDKTEKQQIAAAGIILAGAVYVPIDVGYPTERILSCLDECDAKIVITSAEYVELFGDSNCKAVVIDDILAENNICKIEDIDTDSPMPDDIFDIVFTSGSTGKPKGVVLTQEGMYNHFICIGSELGLSENDSILAVTNYSHDVSFYESFGMFFYGGKVVIPSPEHRNKPHELFGYMKKYDITFWFSVPTIMEMMLLPLLHENSSEKLLNFKKAIIGGEFMPHDLLIRMRRFAPDVQLYNLGGATETSVFNLMHKVTDKDVESGVIPYGEPIWNTKYWIFNDNMELMPVGCTGMICNSGINIAKGYLDSTATNKSFVYNSEVNERVYITGDLGCLRNDRVFMISGRADRQVKINGERVELAEISNALLCNETVKECVPLILKDPVSDKNIIAVVITIWDEYADTSTDTFRKFAEEKLPSFMVPSFFKIIDSLPYTLNNKVDVKALTEMCSAEINDNYKKIIGNTDEKVISVCSNILGIENPDIEKSFLSYGGHSLLIMKVLQVMHDCFNTEITFSEFYNNPTISFLIKKVAENTENNSNNSEMPLFVSDEAKRYEPFMMNDMQLSYYLGQTEKRLGKTPTHMYMAVNCGNINTERFTEAFNKLVCRHDALRTVICSDGEQKTLEKVEKYIPKVIDITDKTENEKEEFFEKYAKEMLYEENDLNLFPCFSVSLVKNNEENYVVCAVINCVMIDGGSISILEDDLIRLYRGDKLNEFTISLRDYTDYISSVKETELYKNSMNYWIERFNTLSDAPDLNVASTDNLESSEVYHKKAFIDKSVYKSIIDNAVKNNIMAVPVQILAYALVIHRWSGSKNFLINIPTFNRVFCHEQVKDMVGEFGSLILLQVDIAENDTVKDVALKLQKQFISDLDHHHVTGVDVMRKYAEKGRQLNAPIVFTSVTSQDERNMSRSDYEMIDWMTQSSKVWIDCIAVEKNEGLEFVWDVTEGIFSHKQTDEMFNAFHDTLVMLSNEENWNIMAFNSVVPDNIELVSRTNDTYHEIGEEPQLLHYGFWKNAREYADRIACVTDGISISYGQMYKMASGVAEKILQLTDRSEEHIMICMQRGYKQAAAALGILFAEKAYLPTNIEWPKDRIKKVVSKANVKIVITDSKDFERVAGIFGDEVKVINIDNCNASELFIINENQNPHRLAYTIFTSGSTGEPKGVAIEHAGAVNTINDVNRNHGITSKDTMFSLSELCFDLSVYDIFGAFNAGGKVYIASSSEKQEVEKWGNIIDSEKVTVWNTVPALCEMLADYYIAEERKFPTLRQFMLSGDWISLKLPDKIRKIAENADIVSMGGATEASIWSIRYHISEVKPEWTSIPYGTAMANQEMYVLNDIMQICPENVPGNIYIGGIGLARCYLNDKEKTEASFVVSPVTGKRLYRTGDMGKYMADGNIEFLGRLDGQVKINGYRIEMGEIENTAEEIAGVKGAIATVCEKKIVLYYTAEEDIDEKEILRYISEKVPHYMIPDICIRIDEIPLSENGKVDRKRLPKIGISENNDEKKELTTDSEKKLAVIFADILDKKDIDGNTNFFTTGGNSVLAIRLISKVKEIFGVKLPVSVVFNFPVLFEMAEKISVADTDKTEETMLINNFNDGKYPLSYAQESMWIECIMENSSRHTLAAYVDIKCSCSLKEIETALNKTADFYNITKSAIRVNDDYEPYLYIENERSYSLDYIDISSLSDRETELNRICSEYAELIFDMENDNLCRFAMIRLEGDTYRLVLVMHHIISDDISFHLFTQKWIDYINDVNLVEKSDSVLSDSTIKFIEHSAREKSRTYSEEELTKMKKLTDCCHIVEIEETNHIERGDIEGSIIDINLDKELFETFHEICNCNKASLYMGFLAVFFIVLSIYTDDNKLSIGIPVSSRKPEEINVAGLMINMEIVYAEVDKENENFVSMLNKIAPVILDYVEENYIPFSNMLRILNADNSKKEIPHHIVYNYLEKQNLKSGKRCEAGEIKYISNIIGHNFGLTVNVEQNDCHLIFSYKNKYMPTELAKKIAADYVDILKKIGYSVE